MAEITDTIGTSGRDFSTITLWEASLSAHSGDDVTGECYNDSAFDEKLSAIDATPTSATLTAASGERHDGTAGTGARIVRTVNGTVITAARAGLEISHLEINVNSKFSTEVVNLIPNAAGNNNIHHMMIHGVAAGASWKSIGLVLNSWDESNPSYLHNSMFWDININNALTWAIISTLYDGPNFYNITILASTNAGAGNRLGFYAISGQAVSQSFKNIAVFGADTDFSVGSPNPIQANNASSDTTASGSGSLTSLTASDELVSTLGGSEDLHLKAGASCIGAGADIGTTPTGVEIDIDGRDRDASGDTWDIGAHQYVTPAAGGSGSPLYTPTRAPVYAPSYAPTQIIRP